MLGDNPMKDVEIIKEVILTILSKTSHISCNDLTAAVLRSSLVDDISISNNTISNCLGQLGEKGLVNLFKIVNGTHVDILVTSKEANIMLFTPTNA